MAEWISFLVSLGLIGSTEHTEPIMVAGRNVVFWLVQTCVRGSTAKLNWNFTLSTKARKEKDSQRETGSKIDGRYKVFQLYYGAVVGEEWCFTRCSTMGFTSVIEGLRNKLPAALCHWPWLSRAPAVDRRRAATILPMARFLPHISACQDVFHLLLLPSLELKSIGSQFGLTFRADREVRKPADLWRGSC